MIEKISTDHFLNTEAYNVYCDKCPYSKDYDIDCGDWDDLMEQMKADGWVSKKVGNEWFNYCGDCS